MAETQSSHTKFELRDYFRIVWHRKWTVFLVLVVVVGGVMFLSYRQTPIYVGKVQVEAPARPGPVGQGGTLQLTPVNLQLEAAKVTSDEVSQRVIDDLALGKIQPFQLKRNIDVAPLKETGILLIEASSPNAERSADLAQTFAEKYLELRREENAVAFVNRLADVGVEIKDANREYNALPEPPDPESGLEEDKEIELQRSLLLTQIAQLEQEQRDLEDAIEVVESGGQILENARVPGKPAQPDHVRDGIIAGIIGLVLGFGAAFLRDYLDDSLRGVEDVERQSGAPLIGVVPHVSPSRGDLARARREGAGEYLVVRDDAKAAATESYRTLRTNLQFLGVSGRLRTVLITSPIKGEGKTTTAANLATVIAQAGQRVLLVGSDLRRPSVHRFFGLTNRVGLSSALAGQVSLMEAVQTPGIRGLRVIAGGPVPPNPAELLGSTAMKQLLTQATHVADWVILDAPPVLGLADASVLATLADGVLMVVNEATDRRVLAHARDQLAKVHSRVVGTVLNNFGPTFSYYYSDYYAYISHYYYQPEPDGRRKGRERRRRPEGEEPAVQEPVVQGAEPEEAPLDGSRGLLRSRRQRGGRTMTEGRVDLEAGEPDLSGEARRPSEPDSSLSP